MEATAAKLLTLGVVIYVVWMLTGRRMMWWGSSDDEHYVPPNGRWVYLSEEPGTFWFALAFHGGIIALMGYVAFLR